MGSFVSVKSYDGTIVRIPKDKVNEFNNKQLKIKEMLSKGKSIEEIKVLIREGAL